MALYTLGCRLNFSETGSIAEGFVERGYKVVDFGEKAEVTFINTCTVTDGADSSCRNLIRKAHKVSPEGTIVVAGCYAQMDSERIAKIQGVDLVLGTSEKYKVFDYLQEYSDQIIHVDKTHDFYSAATSVSDNHTRAFLKIQDGCNYVCSFCIIPFARGRSRALPIREALNQAKELVGQGYQEIVLTGVNIGEYESNTGEKLVDLVDGLSNIEGLRRFRLSSVEPNTYSHDLLSALENAANFQDHFHIPLQSGDDEILQLMKRKYSVSDYQHVIERVLKKFPNAGIGADVIVGFPGESDEQFKNTYHLLKEYPITHFHVFPYSRRKNTVASKMDNHIQHVIKKQRVKELLQLGDLKLSSFSEDQVGQMGQVLFEKKNREGLWEGYTSNFVRVYVFSHLDLKNTIAPVNFYDFQNSRLLGKLL